MENEFPPNSLTKREERPDRRADKGAPEKREVRQITRGKVTLRKKPLHRKFIEAFKPEDNVGFFEHTLLEILVPGIKDAGADAIHGMIDNALGTNSRRSRGRGRGSYTSYNRMSGPRGRRDRDDDDRKSSRRESRSGHSDLREVIVDSRVEAEETLDAMIELLSRYDAVTVRDLLGMVGEKHTFTDEDWGWTDLRGSRIHRIGRDAYLIDLPRPEPLD